MLKDAALLTLDLLKEALNFGLVLKDATPYNVQWHKGKLVFIDTLSFENIPGRRSLDRLPAICECFLSPLVLMHYSKNPYNDYRSHTRTEFLYPSPNHSFRGEADSLFIPIYISDCMEA